MSLQIDRKFQQKVDVNHNALYLSFFKLCHYEFDVYWSTGVTFLACFLVFTAYSSIM